MKKLLFSIICLVFVIFLNGQQLPTFIQFREILFLVNGGLPHEPFIYGQYDADFDKGNFGGEYNHSIGITYRDQWNRLGGSQPKTCLLRYELGLRLDEKSDFLPQNMIFGGLSLVQDEIGVISNESIHFKLGFRHGRLHKSTNRFHYGGGVTASRHNFSFKGDVNLLRDTDDPLGIEHFTHGYWAFNIGIFAQLRLNDWDSHSTQRHHILAAISVNPSFITPNNKSLEDVYRYDLEVQKNIILSYVFNRRRSGVKIKSHEFIGWTKLGDAIEAEGAVSYRMAYHFGDKANTYAWVGFGANYEYLKGFRMTNLFFEPSFLFLVGETVRLKISLAYNLGFLISNDYNRELGRTWESTINGSFHH